MIYSIGTTLFPYGDPYPNTRSLWKLLTQCIQPLGSLCQNLGNMPMRFIHDFENFENKLRGNLFTQQIVH